MDERLGHVTSIKQLNPSINSDSIPGKLTLKVRKITLEQHVGTLFLCYFADFQHEFAGWDLQYCCVFVCNLSE